MHITTAGRRRWPQVPRRTAAYLFVGLLVTSATVAASVGAAAQGRPAAAVPSAGASGSAVASAHPASVAPPVTVIRNVPFVRPQGCFTDDCSVLLNVDVPTGSGPFPTVVLVRGGPTGPGGRGYLDAFAQEMAQAGCSSSTPTCATWRPLRLSGRLQRRRLAVRFARTWSGSYGGDPASVTLVGHCCGGSGSWRRSIRAEATGDCLWQGSGRPNAFVGLSGNYNLDDQKVAKDLAVFFGGTPDQTSEARDAGNPFNYATGSAIPIYLIAGTNDTTVNPAAAKALYAYLSDVKWDVSLTLVPGATHSSITVPTTDGPASLSVILAATAKARAEATSPG